jgi:hypothetical protein
MTRPITRYLQAHVHHLSFVSRRPAGKGITNHDRPRLQTRGLLTTPFPLLPPDRHSLLAWQAVGSGRAPDGEKRIRHRSVQRRGASRNQSIAMPSSTFNYGFAAPSCENNRQAVPDSGPMEGGLACEGRGSGCLSSAARTYVTSTYIHLATISASLRGRLPAIPSFTGSRQRRLPHENTWRQMFRDSTCETARACSTPVPQSV